MPSIAYRIRNSLYLNITNRCNLLCDHCYMAADAHSLPSELTDEETIALVHQMGERGLPALFLSGGEPMMTGFPRSDGSSMISMAA